MLALSTPVVPTKSQYWVIPMPAFQANVSVEPARAVPGVGVVMAAAVGVPPT
jgi:hypothetical protein